MMRILLLLALFVPAAGVQAQWTYRYADQLYGRHNQAFQSEAEPEAGAARFGFRTLGGGRTLVEYVPPASPESEGAVPQWTAPANYPTGYASYLDWTVVIRIGGWESVTVPAGSFRALRVEITGRRGQDPDPLWQVKQAGRFEYTAWFVAGARRPVKSRHRTWSMQDGPFGDDLIELLAR